MPSKVLVLSLSAPSDPKQCSRIKKDYSVLDVRPQLGLVPNDIKLFGSGFQPMWIIQVIMRLETASTKDK